MSDGRVRTKSGAAPFGTLAAVLLVGPGPALDPAPAQALGVPGPASHIACAAQAPPAAAAGQDAVVGTRIAPPFVIEGADGSYTGLAVELWDHVARELGIAYRFEQRDIDGLLDGLEDGELFASAAALTITADREARVDFTHPFFVTGLAIAVSGRGAGLGRALLGLLSPDFLWIFLLLGLLLLFWGTLIWAAERKRNRDEFGGPPARGIVSGFWWAAVTMTTVGYGDKAPRTSWGRVVGLVWMFTAVIVISSFTAAIASSLTVGRIDGRVQGPQDLRSSRVGALDVAAPMAYLAQEGIRATGYPTIDAGLAALAEDRIDAFVHDAPILRYYARETFPGEIRVLPGTFQEQYYGIALPLGSEDRNAVNQALLDHLASDEWARQIRRYLGEE